MATASCGAQCSDSLGSQVSLLTTSESGGEQQQQREHLKNQQDDQQMQPNDSRQDDHNDVDKQQQQQQQQQPSSEDAVAGEQLSLSRSSLGAISDSAASNSATNSLAGSSIAGGKSNGATRATSNGRRASNGVSASALRGIAAAAAKSRVARPVVGAYPAKSSVRRPSSAATSTAATATAATRSNRSATQQQRPSSALAGARSISSVLNKSTGLPRSCSSTLSQKNAHLKTSNSSIASATSTTASSIAPATIQTPSGSTITRIGGGGGSQVVQVGASAAATAAALRRVPTLAMNLRERDQQIKLLIKERDEHRMQADRMARKAEEWEEKFRESELEKSHVTSEADDEVVETRRLAQEFEDENKRLVERLNEREQQMGELQFKLDELECERAETKRELDDKEAQLAQLETDLAAGKPLSVMSQERAISKAKYEREIDELKEKLAQREEVAIQLRSSLEMRKQEVQNLQQHATELERKLKLESERNERHLKRIDEANLELKATEAKLAAKLEENEIYERETRALRQQLRSAEERVEQVSLARKKDVDILHSKLTTARQQRGAGSNTSTPTSPQPYKTPTPQDEIVRLQMELRDTKDNLIEREAELDCIKRDMDVMKRKMETRTLEVDQNNQELARKCQDLLEANRQSEDSVKELLKRCTEFSAQVVRLQNEIKALHTNNAEMRDEKQDVQNKLDEQMDKAMKLTWQNAQLKDENSELNCQLEELRSQVDALNERLSDMYEQLETLQRTHNKEREQMAAKLSQNDIDTAQLRQELATAKQDLRTKSLQTQEVTSERDRLRADVHVLESNLDSRDDSLDALRDELEQSKRAVTEYKHKLDKLREKSELEAIEVSRELRAQIDAHKRELQIKQNEARAMQTRCEQLQAQLEQLRASQEDEELSKFDEMRTQHQTEVDELRARLQQLESELGEAQRSKLKFEQDANVLRKDHESVRQKAADDAAAIVAQANNAMTANNNVDDYKTQVEFLNSLVVDMQRKCDDYKQRMAQLESRNILESFIANSTTTLVDAPPATPKPKPALQPHSQQQHKPLQSCLKRSATLGRQPASGGGAFAGHHRDSKGAQQAARQEAVYYAAPAAGNYTDAGTLVRGRAPNRPTTRISGRPFCDICSVYDMHHTIYCPQLSDKLAGRNVDAAPASRSDIVLVASDGNSQTGSSSIGSSNDSNSGSNSGGDSSNGSTISTHNNNNETCVKSVSDIGQNNNNNNNEQIDVDELFKEYERSLASAAKAQYASMRRVKINDKPMRAYCDHCDTYGHTIGACKSLQSTPVVGFRDK